MRQKDETTTASRFAHLPFGASWQGDKAFCSVVGSNSPSLPAICPWTCPILEFTSTVVHGHPQPLMYQLMQIERIFGGRR